MKNEKSRLHEIGVALCNLLLESLMILESLSKGTPSVSTKTGGLDATMTSTCTELRVREYAGKLVNKPDQSCACNGGVYQVQGELDQSGTLHERNYFGRVYEAMKHSTFSLPSKNIGDWNTNIVELHLPVTRWRIVIVENREWSNELRPGECSERGMDDFGKL